MADADIEEHDIANILRLNRTFEDPDRFAGVFMKFAKKRTARSDLGMLFQESELFVESTGRGNVIGIHDGDVLEVLLQDARKRSVSRRSRPDVLVHSKKNDPVRQIAQDFRCRLAAMIVGNEDRASDFFRKHAFDSFADGLLGIVGGHYNSNVGHCCSHFARFRTKAIHSQSPQRSSSRGQAARRSTRTFL